MFSKTGILSYARGSDEDKIMEAALEAGAEDVVKNDDDSIDVMTSPDDFVDIKEAMIAAELVPENAEITMNPSTSTELDQDGAEKIIKLVDMLEDLDDVQNVYTNADISEEVMARLA